MSRPIKSLPLLVSSVFATAEILLPLAFPLPASAEAVCGGVNQPACGYAKATYLGAIQAPTLNCPSGSFYDPIHTGSCWTCPPNFIRSATAVTSDTACWRPAHEELTWATYIKNTPWAWECPSGSFWDPISWGQCWRCPNDSPRRTAYPVTDSRACAKDIAHQETKATFVSYTVCPDPRTIATGLGKPFFDPINKNGSQWGSCYACPPMSDRTANHVDSDQACKLYFKWNTPVYADPSVYGFRGVKEALLELFNNPEVITTFLYQRARENGFNTPETADRYVAEKWNEIATAPHKSDALKSLVFLQMVGAVTTTEPNRLSDAQKLFVQDLQNYIKARRTFVAQNSLNMYDAWKAGNEWQKTQRRRSGLEVAFDYGTVPPDFYDIGLDEMRAGLGAAAIAAPAAGIVGSLTAASVFATDVAATAVPVTRFAVTTYYFPRSLFVMTQTGNALKGLAGISAVSGATVISLVGTILTSISIEQFIAIVTARPKLEAALQAAQQPVDLRAMLTSGQDEEVSMFWALATKSNYVDSSCSQFSQLPGGGIIFFGGDPTVCGAFLQVKNAVATAAQNAQERARTSGYAVIPTTPVALWKDCRLQGTATSSNTGAGATLTFKNQRQENITMFWIDGTGNRRQYATIAPGQQQVQGSYVGHVWVATSPNGTCQALINPVAAEQTVIIR